MIAFQESFIMKQRLGNELTQSNLNYNVHYEHIT